MRIGDRDVTWEEGKVVTFDDMAPHEVWNSTQEDRIILLLHIKRPLRLPGAMLRNLLLALVRLSPFVQDGVRNMQKWEPAPHGQAHQNARAIEGTNSA
jgi:beta-hydroxylase